MFTEQEAIGYLAGMIDGEGAVCEPTRGNRGIRIGNTDMNIIAAIKEACDVLGITYVETTQRPANEKHKTAKIVHIYGYFNLKKVHDVIPIRCVSKKDRLARTVPTYRVPLDETALRELYDSGLTVDEIAERLNVHFKRVWRAMNRYGIERRNGKHRSDGHGRLSDTDKHERLYSAGSLSQRQLASQFRTSQTTVRKLTTMKGD